MFDCDAAMLFRKFAYEMIEAVEQLHVINLLNFNIFDFF